MILLAMDTSTQVGSVALYKDQKLLSECRSQNQRSHSENINPFIEKCLKQAQLTMTDIDAFAVGIGPGSFTGVRIALNAAKTLAYSYNKPLVGVDSLTALAFPLQSQPTVTMINAYKNMVYLNIFDAQFRPAGPAQAVPVRELLQHIPAGNFLVVGDGWSTYHEYFPGELLQRLTRPPDSEDYPLARHVGSLALQLLKTGQTFDWKSVLPLYIRASEAEETKKGILISPLK